MSPLERLNKMHRDLYRKALSEAMSYGLFPTKNIEVYSQSFEKQLPDRASQIPYDDITRSIDNSQIVLFGDFHTLRQSQRELIRVIRSQFDHPGSSCVIALEMVDAQHQTHIDSYINGEIDDQEFLVKIEYDRRWGFPWQNYRMIFDFARDNGVKVFAVNHEAQGRRRLEERDRVIAHRLYSIAELFPDHKVFSLIGEFHLADTHLPAALKEVNRINNTQKTFMRILNNIDKYYFSMGRSVGNLATDYIQLGERYYCILNTPPWMKWKSLTMWRESQMSIEDDSFLTGDEIADYIEIGFDVEFNFQKMIENVCSFLKIPDAKELADVAYIHLCNDADDLSRFIVQAKSLRLSFEQVAERCERDGFFIDDECNIYITNLTLNNLGNICGRYIRKRRLHDYEDGDFGEADLFCLKVLEYCCGAISRRIMNPSHKTINIHNFDEFLKTHFRKRLKGFAQEKRDEAKLVLDFHHKMLDKDFSIRAQNTNILNHKDTVYANGISKMIGEVLGNRMYLQLVNGQVEIEDIQRLFNDSLGEGHEAASMLQKIYRAAFAPDKETSSTKQRSA